MHTIFYIHGFLSSKNALKSLETKEYLVKCKPDIAFSSIDLPAYPDKAYVLAEEHLIKLLNESSKVSLIGSSLGGFFSMCLASKYNLKAALINPCVNPWDLIPKLLGHQVNPFTGEEVDITTSSIPVLKEIYQSVTLKKENLALYLQRGDEVLDYKVAYKLLAEAAVVHLENGGNHHYEHFATLLPQIVTFFE